MTKNIPFSVSLRIVRICTKPIKRDERLQELRRLLLERDYFPHLVDSAIARARSIPRVQALNKSTKNIAPSKRPVFALKFEPILPAIPNMIAKHLRSMASQD